MPPRAPSRAGTQPRLIDPFVGVIDGWLRTDRELHGLGDPRDGWSPTTGSPGPTSGSRCLLAEARPRWIAAEPGRAGAAGVHRRFEAVPGRRPRSTGATKVLAHAGSGEVYSFHMTLSHSRDLFMCFTTSIDHGDVLGLPPGGVRPLRRGPGRRSSMTAPRPSSNAMSPRGLAVPLHPQSAAFAAHYGFTIDVLAAYRPTGKGRVRPRGPRGPRNRYLRRRRPVRRALGTPPVLMILPHLAHELRRTQASAEGPLPLAPKLLRTLPPTALPRR